MPDRIQSLYVLSLRTPTLHFFSKLTCKNFLFRRFRDTALFFFPFLSGLKKPCVRTFPDARLLIFFLYVSVSFFDVFSGAPYESDFLILTKGIIKKCQRGVLKNMWIIQTPLRTAFHDTQRLLLEVYISNVRSVFVFFRTAYEEMKNEEMKIYSLCTGIYPLSLMIFCPAADKMKSSRGATIEAFFRL